MNNKNVGRSFAFYVKYWEQMSVLYRGEAPESLKAQLTSDELEMLGLVGERSYKQAAELVSECTDALIAHLNQTGLCKAELCSRPSTIEKHWYTEAKVWPRETRGKRANHYAGVWIQLVDGKPAILPWLWVRGGREAEDRLSKRLKSIVQARSRDLEDWDTGSVAIGKIVIALDDESRFLIKKEPLLEATKNALGRLDKSGVRAFLNSHQAS